MKKNTIIILLVTMLLNKVFAQENNIKNYSETKEIESIEIKDEEMSPAIKALIKENEELKKLIYEKAYVNVNGINIEMNGLIQGFAVYYTKFHDAKKIIKDKGSYCEIYGDDAMNYRPEAVDKFNIFVAIDNIGTDWVKVYKKHKAVYEEPVMEIKENTSTENISAKEINNKMIYVILAVLIIIVVLIILIWVHINSIENYSHDIIAKQHSFNESNTEIAKVLENFKTHFNILHEFQDEIKSNYNTIATRLYEKNNSQKYDINNAITEVKQYIDQQFCGLYTKMYQEHSTINQNLLNRINGVNEKLNKTQSFFEEADRNINNIIGNPLNIKKEQKTETDKLYSEEYFKEQIASLSVRTQNQLRRYVKVKTLNELINIPEKELMNKRGFGKKCFRELKAWLEERNLYFKTEDKITLNTETLENKTKTFEPEGDEIYSDDDKEKDNPPPVRKITESDML